MSLDAKITTGLFIELDSQNDLAGAVATVKATHESHWVNGTAAGQASKLFASNRTLAGSASENLDLSGGGLLDANNNAVTFAKIVAIYVKASLDNTDDVVVGGAASATFQGPFGSATSTIHVKPGTEFLVYARDTGWAVTNSTADLLKVADGGSAGVKYQIVLLGA